MTALLWLGAGAVLCCAFVGIFITLASAHGPSGPRLTVIR